VENTNAASTADVLDAMMKLVVLGLYRKYRGLGGAAAVMLDE